MNTELMSPSVNTVMCPRKEFTIFLCFNFRTFILNFQS